MSRPRPRGLPMLYVLQVAMRSRPRTQGSSGHSEVLPMAGRVSSPRSEVIPRAAHASQSSDRLVPVRGGDPIDVANSGAFEKCRPRNAGVIRSTVRPATNRKSAGPHAGVSRTSVSLRTRSASVLPARGGDPGFDDYARLQFGSRPRTRGNPALSASQKGKRGVVPHAGVIR
jgi:hypothetical protein